MPKKISALLITAALSSVTLSGCASLGPHQHAASFPAGADTAPRIEQALADGKFARALDLAEALVAAEPTDAAHRVLLGRSYLANGRYRSARAAFSEAMAFGNREVRTIVSLALCETALGNTLAARTLLSDHIEHLPAGDYGLAMAMAGDAEEGVRALVEAARQPGATARTRQNLAFALALGGAWGHARLIAGQDLPAKEAERRIGEWSQRLAQSDPGQRVAALTGVAPRADDMGMPVHLALQQGPVPAAALAAAEQAPDATAEAPAGFEQTSPTLAAPVEVPAAPAAAAIVQPVAIPPSDRPAQSPLGNAERSGITAQQRPVPVPLAQTLSAAQLLVEQKARLTVPPQQVAPSVLRASFQSAPMAGPSPAALPPVRAQLAGVSGRGSPIAPVSDRQTSDWVVQLGAFNSASVAREKWQVMRRSSLLAGFREIMSAASVDGRVFHRVAVRGFANRTAANSFCGALSAQGQPCYVRLDDSGKTRMARGGAPSGAQLASR